MFKRKMSKKNLIILLVLIVLLVAAGGSALASRQTAADDFIAIQVSYKLDPRITGGVHVGERWVSPPMYDIISSRATYTIEARVEGVSATGERSTIPAVWLAANRGVARITPTHDNIVAIQIYAQGDTHLEVSAAGFTQTLELAAAYHAPQCTNLRVMLAQMDDPNLPMQTCSLSLPLVGR